MKRIIRAVPAFLLLVMPYLMYVAQLIAAYTWTAHHIDYEDIVYESILVVYVVIVLFNIIWTICQTVAGVSGQKLLFWNMLIKLCYIPVFLCLFLGGILFGFMLFWLGGIAMTIVALLVMIALFIPPCIYGVCGCIRASKEGSLHKVLAIVLAILNCIMCVDVIAAVVTYCIVSSSNKKRLRQMNANVYYNRTGYMNNGMGDMNNGTGYGNNGMGDMR